MTARGSVTQGPPHGERIDAGKAGVCPGSGELAEGPFWFKVVLVYDGASQELGQFFENNVIELDRVTGRGVHVTAIGHPNAHGKLYSALRTPQRAAKDAADAREYQRLVVDRGSEAHHRRIEEDNLVDLLGIPRDAVPCLAFVTTPRFEPVPVLRIEKIWLRSPDLQDALREVLTGHLAEDRILPMGTPGCTTTAELASRIEPVIDAIRHDMESAVSRLHAPPAKLRRSTPSGFPLPLDARWQEVRIEFVDYNEVDVTFRGREKRFRYDMMGFTDRRSNRPNKQWELLEQIGRAGGACTWAGSVYRKGLEKRIDRLSKALKRFFAMRNGPFELETREHRWAARFTVVAPD